MIPLDLSYECPQAVYLSLFSLLILLLSVYLYVFRASQNAKLGTPQLLAEVLIPRSNLIFWIKTGALALLWILAVAALMGPRGNARYPDEEIHSSTSRHPSQLAEKAQRPVRDVFVLIDASASMEVKDSRNGVTRLDLAKDIADQFVSRLNGENVALLAFTSELTQMSPLTLDYLFVRLRLRELQINEGNIPGTDFKHLFQELEKDYVQSPSQKMHSVIIFTDGGDTGYQASEGEAKTLRKKEILDLIDAMQQRARVFIVGMGSLQGAEIPGTSFQGRAVHSSLDAALLNQMAVHGQGIFYDANQRSAVDIADELLKDLSSTPAGTVSATLPVSKTSAQHQVYDYFFQMPLGFAVLLLLLVILCPDSLSSRHMYGLMGVFFMFSVLEAQQDTENFRQAESAYQAGDFAKARQVFEDLLNQPLSEEQQAVTLYNLGSLYLAAGDNVKALALFKSIDVHKDYSVMLLKNLYLNLAMAYLQASYMPAEESFDSLSQRYFLLQESLHALNAAKNADCSRQKREGSSTCSPPYDLWLFEQTVKVQLSKLYDEINRMIAAKQAMHPGDILQRLIWHYQCVFLGDNIYYSTLSLLQQEQMRMAAQLSKPSDPSLDKANAWLQKSLTVLASHRKQAELYLLLAYHELVVVQRTVHKSSDQTPLAALEEVIEDQREALRMTRLIYEMEKESPPTDLTQEYTAVPAIINHEPQNEAKEGLAGMAEEYPKDFALDTAKSFFSFIYRHQVSLFVNPDKKSPEECCQAEPWEQVLPVFEQGYQYAELANNLKGLDSVILQSKALSSWMQVKQMLSSPIKPRKGSCFAARKAREQEASSKTETSTSSSSFERTARELESMERADNSLLTQPIKPIKVERPW